MKTIYAVAALGFLLAESFAQTTVESGAAIRSMAPASARDGFTLRGTEVVMTRDGTTTKVDREMILPNGLRVLANGSVTLPDGSNTELRPNQLLTFEGTAENVALTPQGTAPVSSVTTNAGPTADAGKSSRDGITISGAEMFITRNGVTEKVNADVSLPNGVTAQPNGTLILANGNRFTMRPNQILGLDGILRDAPAGSAPMSPALVSPTR